jgi:hypothetical protein
MDILATAVADLKGVARVLAGLATGRPAGGPGPRAAGRTPLAV